ncbi:hypothetical protein FJTKL_03738 [Diaporthe vaccinii]|uniref:Uncharacterized protein n=1 Tax=Diaporthe vaccinii TaxID=105482 RepID=A0ABR4DUB9_9PEZI
MFSGLPSPAFIFVFELALLNRRTGRYRTSATPRPGTATNITTMCTLKKQCYACKGGCVEQVVVHCPSYLAGYDCGQSDVTRAGQAGGMLLQEILHMSPCPKHGIDNPHDQCKEISHHFLPWASVRYPESGRISLRMGMEVESGTGPGCVRIITIIRTWDRTAHRGARMCGGTRRSHIDANNYCGGWRITSGMVLSGMMPKT